MIEGADAWSAIAANYREYAEPHTMPFARDAWRLAEAGGAVRVLDVAAGTGAFTLVALADGATVTATDLSPAMIALLRARFEPLGAGTRATATVMDGQALDLPDRSFDLVASIFGVILFPDPRRGLAEMVRVTRPGGRVVVGAWAGEGSGAMRLFLAAYRRCLPERPAFAFPAPMEQLTTRKGIEDALGNAGLTTIEVHAVTHDWTFPDPNWLRVHAERLYAFLPIWTALSFDERAQLTEEMIARLSALERPALPSTALIAIARRPA